MAEMLRNTAFGKVRGVPDEDGHYVLVSYQPKLAAEPAQMPHLRHRVPHLRNSPTMPGGAHFKKMIQPQSSELRLQKMMPVAVRSILEIVFLLAMLVAMAIPTTS